MDAWFAAFFVSVTYLSDLWSSEGGRWPVVSTQQGPVRGLVSTSLENNTYFSFEGIPYAKPPTGHLRFQPPEPAEKWTEIYDATYTVQCPQYLVGGDRVVGNESCLILNVYTPQLVGNLPVMVWIHGGGFMTGSSLRKYYGADLLMDHGVVLVTLNYRLGALGFLSTADDVVPGNNGMKDQVLALRWVQENIVNFGGNPANVTLFGESAGGASVFLHMLSPMSKGLFHRAAAESGFPRIMSGDENDVYNKARTLAQKFGCPTGTTNELIDCLREQDAHKIARYSQEAYMWLELPLSPFGPVQERAGDNRFLDVNPWDALINGNFAPVPYITGFNRNEGAMIAVDILENDDVSSDLNRNWNRLSPAMLNYLLLDKENTSTANAKIREFYFGNDQIGVNRGNDLIFCIGDRYYVHPIYQGAKLQAGHNKAPVFVYELTYRGKNTIIDVISDKKSLDYGISHADDVQYLFNSKIMQPIPFVRGESDFDFRNMFLTLWANFAKTGDPTPGKEIKQQLGFEWSPLTPDTFQYLELNWPPVMRKEDYLPMERINFWEGFVMPDRPPHYIPFTKTTRTNT